MSENALFHPGFEDDEVTFFPHKTSSQGEPILLKTCSYPLSENLLIDLRNGI
jgi:hypothetical protein